MNESSNSSLYHSAEIVMIMCKQGREDNDNRE